MNMNEQLKIQRMYDERIRDARTQPATSEKAEPKRETKVRRGRKPKLSSASGTQAQTEA